MRGYLLYFILFCLPGCGVSDNKINDNLEHKDDHPVLSGKIIEEKFDLRVIDKSASEMQHDLISTLAYLGYGKTEKCVYLYRKLKGNVIEVYRLKVDGNDERKVREICAEVTARLYGAQLPYITEVEEFRRSNNLTYEIK